MDCSTNTNEVLSILIGLVVLLRTIMSAVCVRVCVIYQPQRVPSLRVFATEFHPEYFPRNPAVTDPRGG